MRPILHFARILEPVLSENGGGTVADAGETTKQTTDDDSAAHSGEKWGDPITSERQATLRALHERQQEWVAQPEATRGYSVFTYERLTGADVFWLPEASGGSIRGGAPNLHLEGADLSYAQRAAATLSVAQLSGADLSHAQLAGAILIRAQLQGADLNFAQLAGATLSYAQLEGGILSFAQLEGADLSLAQLEGAILRGAQLAGADLSGAQMEGANLGGARLKGANLTSATFDKTSRLNGAVLTGASLDQATYDGVNLTVVDWTLVPVLGDELTARQRTNKDGTRKDRARRIDDFATALHAYRVLSVTLRSQGMNEDADRYAYRAQRMQRVVLRLRRRYLSYLGSLFIDVLAGYGFRPERSLLVYLAVILWFANFYVWASHGLFSLGLLPTHVQPLAWYEGLILSVSSFHGRGFQPFQNLNDPIAALAGIQAVFGLIIEVSFIATFTQRFFAR